MPLLTADREAAAPVQSVRQRTPAAILAAVLGLLAALLAIAVPFLPVQERTATLQWPQQSSMAEVSAPLVAYVPQQISLTVPCAALAALAGNGGGVAVSTVPAQAPLAGETGLVARVKDGTVDVVLRNQSLLSAPVASLNAPGCALQLSSTAASTTAQLAGRTGTVAHDVRPQLTGVYSDLRGDVPAGLSVTATIDTRFSTSPTAIKLAAMLVAAGCAFGSLLALHLMDHRSRHRPSRLLKRRWWRPTLCDAAVVAVLALWHVIGTNTSDDGYLLTMARASRSSGYLANYYRWLGVPEAPFGWYYELIDVLSRVSSASPWLRLPTLLIGVLTWLTLSREVLPRLGHVVKRSRSATWTAAMVFLAFWLPYNNGLRPEPLVALGVLVTWCAVERSIASERLLPAALALLASALTVAAGPTGLICLLPLLAGLKPLFLLVRRRAEQVGMLATLAPLVAAGLVVLVLVFADQTLSAVLEATRVRAERGPNVAWYDEFSRYSGLFGGGADGSIARRFPVLVVILALAVCTAVLLRRRKLPGAPVGPSRRLIATTAGSFGVLAVTPTKWTHHFGAFAGIGAALAALTAVAVSAAMLRSRRNRALFLVGLLGVLAFSLAGWNDWLYTSAWGIPWFDRIPALHGIRGTAVALTLAVGAAGVAVVLHLRSTEDSTAAIAQPAGKPWLRVSPLAVVAGLVVLAEVLSFAKAAVQRWPNYTVAAANIDALGGHPCALADAVRVESEPFSGVLATADGVGTGLDGPASTGFSSRGLPPELDPLTAEQGEGPIKGASALPAGLAPGRTPVVGSWSAGAQQAAELTTSWYRLPTSTVEAPLLVVSAAGWIAGTDAAGVHHDGVNMTVQFGRSTGPAVQQLGQAELLDPGPAPRWRNLRVPLSAAPAGADRVRLEVRDDKLDQQTWAALTQPRVPKLTSLQSALATSAALVDWPVGLEFPCLRPFAVHDGVAELPVARVSPQNGQLRVASDNWQDAYGGGPLGWLNLVATQHTVPSYLAGDWGRDWGSLERFVPYRSATHPAVIDSGTRTVWGLAHRESMLGLH